MKRALIAGAGIAGLATALRLGRDGFQTVVVERAPARRSSGYLVNLLGAGFDAAEGLGLVTALRAYDLGVFTTVLTHADGRPKLTVPSALAEAALGPRALTVFRGDLEATLFEAARELTDVRFGTTVTSMDQHPSGVRVKLSDGAEVEADLVVGADGVHSQTRESVLGPGLRVDKPYVVAAFGDLGGGVEEALRHLGPDTYFDSVSQVVMPRWSEGRVVLLGDAAWCVTVFAGGGAALALAGADQLGKALQHHTDIPGALTAWEAGLRPEVIKRQKLAQRGMLQYAPPSRFHVWLGDVAIRAFMLRHRSKAGVSR